MKSCVFIPVLEQSLHDGYCAISGLRKLPSFGGFIALNYFPGMETDLYIYVYVCGGFFLHPDGLGTQQYSMMQSEMKFLLLTEFLKSPTATHIGISICDFNREYINIHVIKDV